MNPSTSLARRILANDLRLFIRGRSKSKSKWSLGVAGSVVLIALLHLPAYAVFANVGSTASSRGGAELLCVFTIALVSMSALTRSLEILYDRGDLPMLLASPVPARIVLLTRLCDVALTTLLGTAAIVFPIVDTAIYFFGGRWAWAWLAWVCATLALSPVGVLVTLWTIQRIGAQRARTALQVLSITIGLFAMLAMQLPNCTRRAGGAGPSIEPWHYFDISVLQVFVKAAGGDLVWLFALASSAIGFQVLAWRGLGKSFTSGAQAAVADLGGGRSGASSETAALAWQGAFSRTRRPALVKKELRTLLRDPLLLARCSMQIVSLIPALIGVMLANRAIGFASLALVGGPIAAITLAATMTFTDEGHEFAAASPTARSELVASRTIAAALPVLLVAWALGMVPLALGFPLSALMTVLATSALTPALAWFVACRVLPASAEQRARNGRPGILGPTLLAMLLGGMASGGIAASSAGQFAVGIVFYFGAVLGGAALFLVRPRPEP